MKACWKEIKSNSVKEHNNAGEENESAHKLTCVVIERLSNLTTIYWNRSLYLGAGSILSFKYKKKLITHKC